MATKYYNEKAKERTNRYRAANRDKLTFDMPKGDKERYKRYAESKGLSLSKLLISLIEREMQDNP